MAATFLMADRLPASAAFLNHSRALPGSDSASMTPRLHMEPASPASAAMVR